MKGTAPISQSRGQSVLFECLYFLCITPLMSILVINLIYCLAEKAGRQKRTCHNNILWEKDGREVCLDLSLCTQLDIPPTQYIVNSINRLYTISRPFSTAHEKRSTFHYFLYLTYQLITISRV